jgi:hypothetical protein
LASITYFKAEPGDEVAVVMPKDIESSWIAIENVLQKGSNGSSFAGKYAIDDEIESLKKELKEKPEEKPALTETPAGKSVIDEWTADIEEIEREMQKDKVAKE